MFHYLREYKWCLVGGLLLSLLIFLAKPYGKSITKTQIGQMRSDVQLQAIAKLVFDYKSKHEGKSPERLSELVPDDRPDYLQMFYVPNEPEAKKPINRLTDKHVLDTAADYVLPLKLNSGILVRERTGLWPDGSVAVCFDDLTFKRLKPAEFAALRLEQ